MWCSRCRLSSSSSFGVVNDRFGVSWMVIAPNPVAA
jgi:uncharacterized glyoxalase superfamily protein PhnB